MDIGTTQNASETPAPTTPSADTAPEAASQPGVPQEAGLAPNDPNLQDYVQRYNENVLGQGTTNWGNVILLVMIGALLIGGGGLVLHNEHFVNISFRETKAIEGEYPVDVVDMMPELAKLKPAARKSLRRLLEKPEATAEVLTSLDKLTEGDSAKSKE